MRKVTWWTRRRLKWRGGENFCTNKGSKKLEQEHWSQFLAIEPESEDYFLGETLSEAMQAARRAHPDRMCFGMRIGTPIHMGELTLNRAPQV